MKSLTGILGGLCLFLAVIFFVHGSMKTNEASGEQAASYELDDGIVIVEEKQSETYANYSFNIAGGAAILGLVLIFLGRRKN